jgi:hypothetical protein
MKLFLLIISLNMIGLLAESEEERRAREYFEKRESYLKTQKVTSKPLGALRNIDVKLNTLSLVDDTTFTIIPEGCVIQLPTKLRTKISQDVYDLQMLSWSDFYKKNKNWIVGVEAPEAAVNGDYKIAAQFIKENLDKYTKVNKVVVATWKDSLVTLVEVNPTQPPKQDKKQ